jgi:hypothetical protein
MILKPSQIPCKNVIDKPHSSSLISVQVGNTVHTMDKTRPKTASAAQLPGAVLFDAYGTLLDVYSVGLLAEQLFPGHGQALSVLWRDKQIDYTRLVTTSRNGP